MNKVKAIAGRMPMAPGYRVVFTGEGEDMIESFGYMAEALLLAVIFVYLILAAQFESFIEPFSIMLSLPLSIVGMAGMLLLTGDTVNIMSLIGLIMLMGLVTKNAILLVDYAKVLQGRGMGAGAEERAPMARAVVGGLVTSTYLTLLVVPVVYTLLDDFAVWMRRKWEGEKPAAAAVAAVLILLHGVPLIGPPSAVAADPPGVEVLTLDETLRATVVHSRDVRKAMELRTFLEGKYVEERASALPQFLGTAEASRAWDDSLGIFGAPPGSNRYAAQVGVSQPLYSSGVVSAGIRAAGVGLATADDRLRIAQQAALRDVFAVFHDVLVGWERRPTTTSSRRR